MSWGPGFMAPPHMGHGLGGARWGSPNEWNMHATHAYVCLWARALKQIIPHSLQDTTP